jgi:SDR family mycofactocin-dependent oxidoreductase
VADLNRGAGLNRVALVTGAARGIGAATVAALVALDYRVVAVDSCTDDPDLPYSMATPAELAALAGPAVLTVQADVRDPAALAAAVEQAESAFGGLDVAVAAAGVIAGGVPHWEVPAATEQAVLDIDLGGVLNLARVAVPALLRRPEPRTGRFVAVASAAATRGLPMLAAYCAAKAGVAGFVRALAVELGDSGVSANAVSPGSTDTPILAESARLYGLDAAADFARQQPVHRLLRPAEIAAAIVFLAGADASALTGAVIPVDGGLGL